MSQRGSGYTRKELDLYETPAWLTHALREHLPHQVRHVWEPACGSGKMVAALEEWGIQVSRGDISGNQDFFHFTACQANGIVTNPPYSAAVRFIGHALALTKPSDGFVAMLLRTDFDHAKSRQHLFGKCAQFGRKVVLTKRIRWF
jgi:hypothetical protein